MITLTDSAASKVGELIAAEGDEGLALRVAVRPGGCSGFSYAMGFDEEAAKEQDQVIETEGISLYVDEKSMEFLNGMTVDFHEDLMQRGFVFKNPNQTSACGCGESVAITPVDRSALETGV